MHLSQFGESAINYLKTSSTFTLTSLRVAIIQFSCVCRIYTSRNVLLYTQSDSCRNSNTMAGVLPCMPLVKLQPILVVGYPEGFVVHQHAAGKPIAILRPEFIGLHRQRFNPTYLSTFFIRDQ